VHFSTRLYFWLQILCLLCELGDENDATYTVSQPILVSDLSTSNIFTLKTLLSSRKNLSRNQKL